MRARGSWFVAGVVLCGLAALAEAQENGPAAPAPAEAPKAPQPAAVRWATPPEPRLPAAAKDFQPAAEQLPAHVKLLDGALPATEHAARFWSDPAAKGLVDAPSGKHAFALQAEGGKAGTVYVYEYAEERPANLEDYLSLLLWLAEDYPTEERPDQVHFAGRYAFVFSFPIADPGVEWFKSHLRRHFAIPAMTNNRAHHEIYEAFGAAADTEDPAAVLAAYAAHEERASRDSFCRLSAGRAARDMGDWPLALAHYEAALALARSMDDPISPGQVFEALTWCGYALMNQDEPAGAIEPFRVAKSWGVAHDVGGSAVWGPYNLCCALTKAGRLDDAVVELREAIDANAEIKPHAREDQDLAALREREDVRKLLAEE